MSWSTHSINNSDPVTTGEAFDTPMCGSSPYEAQVVETSHSSPGEQGPHFSYMAYSSAPMNEMELEQTEHQEDGEDDEGEDSDTESIMGEFDTKYNEGSDPLHGPNDESHEPRRYPVRRAERSEPMRARNRSGPPIPPPVPVRPGQLFFSNQIWTRLNVEQQVKLGALKVGSKNKSFKTRPWLVVERSNRVDSDGQQMLWVMCCTTRNRHGWEGVSYRDSKSFIPMAPTPSRYGRPVLPLVTDEREVFLGGSLLFLEVFKEIKPTLLGDYIGHISDESVSIVNKEQLRVAEERRKKEEQRAAQTAAQSAKRGSNRKGNGRHKAGAETDFHHHDNRHNGHSVLPHEGERWGTPHSISPFYLPTPTGMAQASPSLDPRAPAFHDPAHQGHRDNRRRSLSGRGMQSRPQYNQVRQTSANFNQTPDHGSHSPQNYGGRGGYNNNPGIHGGHEHNGNRRRSSSGGRGSYIGFSPPQNPPNYGSHTHSPGYFSHKNHGSTHTGSQMLERDRFTPPSSTPYSYAGGNVGNSGRRSGGFAQGGPAGWTAPRRDQRR